MDFGKQIRFETHENYVLADEKHGKTLHPAISHNNPHHTIHPWSLPGFNRLRMHTQYKPATSNQPSIQQLAHTGGQGTTTTTQPTANHIPVAFAEFRDVHTAGHAMQLLQGKYLLSSDRGAIRIEYAKSKMSHEQFHHYPISQMMAPNGCYQASPIMNGSVAWQN